MQTSNYLDQLVEDLNTLKTNLDEKGIEVQESDTFTQLSAKVADITNGAYLEETVADMEALPKAKEDDKCIVYSSGISQYDGSYPLTSVNFPATVVLDEAYTSSFSCGLEPTEEPMFRDFDISLSVDESMFEIQGWGYENSSSLDIRVSYSSSDGITYTRNALEGRINNWETGDNQDFVSGDTITFPFGLLPTNYSTWDTVVGKFISFNVVNFSGIYSYTNNSWGYLPVGINGSNQDFMKGTVGYTDNGFITGAFPDNSQKSIKRLNGLSSDLYKLPPNSTDFFKGLNDNSFSVWIDTSEVVNAPRLFKDSHNINYIGLTETWDTSNISNMSSMFDSCYRLKSINVSNWNMSNVRDITSMFRYCQDLTELNLSGWDTSNVTNLDSFISECRNLRSINLSGWNTSNVKSMSLFMYGCNNLSDINLKGLDLSNVTSMGSAFYSSGIRNIDLSNMELSNLTTMTGLFKGCFNLTDVNLSNMKANKVTSIAELFYSDPNVVNIEMGDFYAPNLTNVARLVVGCNNLKVLNMTNLYIPVYNNNTKNTSFPFKNANFPMNLDLNLSGFTLGSATSNNAWGLFNTLVGINSINLSNANISTVNALNGMFRDSKNISEINLYGANLNGINGGFYGIGTMFYGCSNLKKVDFRNVVISNSYDLSYLYDSSGLTGVIDVCNYIPNPDIVHDFTWTFANCNKITELNYSNCWIGDRMLNGCIGCTNLTTLNFSNCKIDMSSGGSSPTYYQLILGMCNLALPNLTELNLHNAQIGSEVNGWFGQFINNSYIKNVDMTNINTGVKMFNMGYAFMSNRVESINMRGGVFPNINNAGYMFPLGMNNLKYLDISDISFPNVTTQDVRGLIPNAPNLQTVLYNNVSFPNATNLYSMFGGAFVTDIDATQIYAPKAETFLNMFSNCVKLVNVNINMSSYPNLKDMTNMFRDCVNLTGDIDWSNISSLNKVVNAANLFVNCRNLTSVNFANTRLNVLNLMTNMFLNCRSLKTVNLANTHIGYENWAYGTSMFMGCSSLEEVNLSGINRIASFYNGFSGCTNLRKIDIRDLTATHLSSNTFTGVPSDCEIIVINAQMKSNILNVRSDFTNITIA